MFRIAEYSVGNSQYDEPSFEASENGQLGPDKKIF
jgi:hypothetical protein